MFVDNLTDNLTITYSTAHHELDLTHLLLYILS